jgi:hypothetical protein
MSRVTRDVTVIDFDGGRGPIGELVDRNNGTVATNGKFRIGRDVGGVTEGHRDDDAIRVD